MIAIEGIPRSMYHGPMLTNYCQTLPGAPSINGVMQRPGLYFEEQKSPGISVPSTFQAQTDENDKPKQQQQWKEAFKQRKEYSTLKKVILVLQDNRLKNGDPKTMEKLRELNRSQSESCPLLKTILNVMLVSTAVVLLIAVIVVIIYTSVRNPPLVSQMSASDDHDIQRQYYDDNQQLHTEKALESPPSLHYPGLSDVNQSGLSQVNQQQGGDFKPRTRVETSNALRCRMIPVVTDEGTIVLRQLCFKSSVSINGTL